MHTKTKRIAGALALGLGLLATGAHASSSILSFSNLVTDSSNLGAMVTVKSAYVGVGATGVSSSSVDTYSSVLSSEIQTPATATTTGLINYYSTLTTTHHTSSAYSIYDYLRVNVATGSTNQTGDKWISLTGTVTSSENTSLSFYFGTQGSFTATTTPFGSAAPTLSSFYFGSSSTAVSASTYANLPTQTYSSSSWGDYYAPTLSLIANQAQSFIAYVYAPAGVSLNSLSLQALTDVYGSEGHSSVSTTVEKILLSSLTIPMVPEPESYAMLLAGLGLIGTLGRRRKVL